MEEGIYLGRQLGIVAAKAHHFRVLLFGGPIADGEKNFLDALVLFGGHFSAAQFAHEPGSGHGPIPLDRSLGYAQHTGDFIDAHAGEKPHLHYLCLSRIELSELAQRLVEGEDFLGSLGRQGDGFVQSNLAGSAAALLTLTLASVVDENPADRLRADGEKMRPTLPIHAGLIDQAEISLVHQRCWLERMVGPLAAKMPGGEGAKFIVDERHQLGGR